ncbi:MAG TPA: single-stranded DNA-binding protein [Haliscomenobacter sp.]|uniref:single-stranded DNA-binding protein n=1 Tax=Haliscomenobacter sp. TaxID=2717303 RepID=UPI002BEB49C0|nr:single-stranded DNA-binding protein [Haliscomenobacter sp.]HOY16773.1 single-stranded DNA-binding protein [Haliscomenobacter sp.]
MVNRVILIGNLGKDPEVRSLENGAMVAKFSLATGESYRDKEGNWQEQTEWHDIIVWRAVAERAEKSLKKGMTIYLEGKLTHRTWQDKDGNNRKTTEIVADYFRIVKNSSGANGASFPSEKDDPNNRNNVSNVSDAPMPTASEELPVTADDDLPF